MTMDNYGAAHSGRHIGVSRFGVDENGHTIVGYTCPLPEALLVNVLTVGVSLGDRLGVSSVIIGCTLNCITDVIHIVKG